MTGHHPPRLALALLERLVPDSAPLAGDLVEEFVRRPSRAWFWWQVIAAVAISSFEGSAEIRPLRLVEKQPADAIERSRRILFRFRPVNLTGSPTSDVGGLSLVILGFLVSIVAPGVWLLLVGSTVAGVLLGILLVRRHAKSPDTGGTLQLSTRPY